MNGFFNIYIDDSIEARTGEIEAFLASVSEAASHTAELEEVGQCDADIILAGDDFIHELNLQYRNVDSTTDVLSFPATDLSGPLRDLLKEDPDMYLEESENGDAIFLGEIYISIDKAREQAEEYGNTFLEELRFLTVHGTLHLLGYDHIEEEDELIMREKQRIALGRKNDGR